MPTPPKPRTAPKPGGLPTLTGTQTRVRTTPTIEEQGDQAVSTKSGIIPFAFYSLTNASGQMLRPGVADALSVPIPFRGSVVGLGFSADTSCSGTYTVYKDGVATEALLIASAETDKVVGFSEGTYGFVAGNLLDVRASTVSTSAIVEVVAYVFIDPSTIL